MKRSSLVLISVLLIGAVLLGGCAPKTTATIKVATDATWPPFEMVDETTKELTGFDVDMMKAIAAKTGLNIEFVNIGFDPLLAGMAQCQYDAAASALTITPDRQKDMLFSDPYLSAGQIVTVKLDNTDIKSKDDLSGKKVGAQIGTTGAYEVETNIPGAELTTFDSIDLAFLALKNGQIDAVVADEPMARGYVEKFSDSLKIVGERFTNESYAVAICKTNTDLQAKINEGLAAIKADGTFAELLQKYTLSE